MSLAAYAWSVMAMLALLCILIGFVADDDARAAIILCAMFALFVRQAQQASRD